MKALSRECLLYRALNPIVAFDQMSTKAYLCNPHLAIHSIGSLREETHRLRCKILPDEQKENFCDLSSISPDNCLSMLQGRLKPVPIEEGRKILSRKGQQFFDLGDRSEQPQLPVFSKLSGRKSRPSKACHFQAQHCPASPL